MSVIILGKVRFLSTSPTSLVSHLILLGPLGNDPFFVLGMHMT